MADPKAGIPRRAIAGGAITPKKIDEATGFRWSYFMATGHELPNVVSVNNSLTKPTAPIAQYAWATHQFKNGPVNVRYLLAESRIAFIKSGVTGGTNLQLDAGNTDAGRELVWASHPELVSGHPATDPFIYTVGQTGPMVVRLKGVMDDPDNSTVRVGFRKGQASPTTFALMTDAAAVAWDGSIGVGGDVKTQTQLNGGGLVETTIASLNNVWAAGEEHELKCVIGVRPYTGAPSAGVARFFFDGAEVGAPFTFDATDEIFPFIENLDNGGGGHDFYLTEMEVAFLADIDDYFAN